MDSFAIMRCSKLKSLGNVAASLEHCFRTRDTPNADPDKTKDNYNFRAGSYDAAYAKIKNLLPEKRRKDAVICVEYVMTASPDWWRYADKAAREKFCRNSIEWLEDKYGKENVVVATIHNDETTPHLSAFVVPLKDGKLNAKSFIGSRSLLQQDQTSYAAKVGLTRGIMGSKAEHKEIKDYYGALKADIRMMERSAAIEVDELKRKNLSWLYQESWQGVADRLTEKMQERMDSYVYKAERYEDKCSELWYTKNILENVEKQRQYYISKYSPIEDLTYDNQRKVFDFAAELKERERRLKRQQELVNKQGKSR